MTSLLTLLALSGPAEATPAGVLLTAAEIAFLDSVVPAGSVLAASDSALIAEQLAAEWLSQQAKITAAQGVAAEGGATAAAGRYIAGVARMHQQVVLKAAQAIGQLETVSAAILAHTGSTFLGLLIIDAGQYDSYLYDVPSNQHTSIFWDGQGAGGISWLSFESTDFYDTYGTGGGGLGSGGNQSGGGPEGGAGGSADHIERSYEINNDPDPGEDDGGGDDPDDGSQGYFSDSGAGDGWAGCIVRPTGLGRNGLTTQFSDAMHDVVATQLNGLSELAIDLDRVYVMSVSQVPFDRWEPIESAAYTAAFIVTPHGDRLEVACGNTMMVDAGLTHLEQIAAGDLSSFEGSPPPHIIDDAIEAIEHMAEPVHFDAEIRPQDLEASNR